jgi:ATP-dependent protease HslVU (ClpYQ) peptidase subunit
MTAILVVRRDERSIIGGRGMVVAAADVSTF